MVLGDSGDEGHETGTAEELGNKDSGMGLGLWAVYPFQALPKHAVVAAALSKNPATAAAHSGWQHFNIYIYIYIIRLREK